MEVGRVRCLVVVTLALACAGVSLAACNGISATPTVLRGSTPTGRPTVAIAPSSTPTLAATAAPTHRPTRTPRPTPTPQPPPKPVQGYWIQNTTRDGLCSDSPRFIGFDRLLNQPYIGGGNSTICYQSHLGLEWRGTDCCDPLFGLPNWHSIDVPGAGYVTGAAGNSHLSVVGTGGRCVFVQEFDPGGQAPKVSWDCNASVGAPPFDDIRGYAVVRKSNVEWFMSADSIASLGLPDDRVYSIPEQVGVAEARPTWLAVGDTDADGVWIGTNGYGVLHIQPDTQVTRYTIADGLPNDTIRDVQVYRYCARQRCSISVWAATAGGVGHWDGTNWTAYTAQDGLPSDDVRGVSVSYYGVWAATAAGPALFLYGADHWQTFPDFPTGVDVNGVMGDWFTTRGQGLVQFVGSGVTRGEVTQYTAADGLPGGPITALAATANGVLAGTPRGAVEWNGQTWTAVTSAAVNDASSAAIATDGGLWVWDGDSWDQVNNERVTLVGSDGWYATPDRLCRRAGGAALCPTDPNGQPIRGAQALAVRRGTAIVVDGDGRFWFCASDGCSEGDYATTLENAYLPQRLNDLLVTESSWWYATQEGIYDASTEWGNPPDITSGDISLSGGWPISVRQISLDETTRNIWIATSQGAFYQRLVDPERERGGWTFIAGLPDRDLTAVLPLPDGSVWLGTANAGVIHFVPDNP